MYRFLLLFIAPVFIFATAGKEQAKSDEQIIHQYISEHHLKAKPIGNRIYYVPVVEGTGSNPASNSKITVNYKAYLTNDSVLNKGPLTCHISELIPGLRQCIPLMKKGGKATFIIPSALTDEAISSSAMIFDIELLSWE